MKNYKEIECAEAAAKLLQQGGNIKNVAFQDIDFLPLEELAKECNFTECIFLGGKLPQSISSRLDDSNLLFTMPQLPYKAFRNSLYSARELYEGYITGSPQSYENSFDKKVYNHYLSCGKTAKCIKESLARVLHDHSINDAMHDFLQKFDERKVVGIMGGHGLSRNEDAYIKVASIAKQLTEKGFLIVTGGGPGAMEASHLGAWMAGRTEQQLADAVQMLQVAPSYEDELWLNSAFEVMEKYPCGEYVSLGVPTWLYGHEPATPFATHIAKFFDNSIREDSILTIAKGGIIYSPGSAGTMQEIFQDAVQNHYLSLGYSSPMIFFDSEYWTTQMPVYPFLEHLCKNGKYKNLLLSITDSPQEVVNSFPELC